MKKIILVILITIIHIGILASQEWQTDFSVAKKMATEESKSIILVFQGSDWCAPCIKLDREIWSTDTFKEYAAANFIMLQADFPRRKKNKLSEHQSKANAALAETYNQTGVFPFVVVLDSQGNVLGETSYKKTTPAAYIKELNNFIQ